MLSESTSPAVGAARPTDPLIRAGRIPTKATGEATQRAVAVRGDSIVATSATPDGLDHLANSRRSRAARTSHRDGVHVTVKWTPFSGPGA
jgi:predicted amidohydrolase YtcJ